MQMSQSSGPLFVFFKEDLVVDDGSLPLAFFVHGFGRLLQRGEVVVHVRWFYSDQRYAPEGTFGVVLLSKQCGGSNNTKTTSP
jgi:hypothetical protein